MGSGFAGGPQFGRFNHDPEASDYDNGVRNEADLVGKTMLRRSKIFIAIGIQNCRELRRSDIFRLNPKRSPEVQEFRRRLQRLGSGSKDRDRSYSELPNSCNS